MNYLLIINLYFFLFISIYTINAQNSINTLGGNVSSSEKGSISYSVGQIGFKSTSSSQYKIIEGVQQPFDVLTSLSIIGKYNISIGPNPFLNYIYIAHRHNNNFHIDYFLYNCLGNLVHFGSTTNDETYINTDNLYSGPYLLMVISNDGTSLFNKILIKY